MGTISIGSSAAVTKASLIRQVYANVYNLLNDRTNVPDPLDSNGSRKFIYFKPPNPHSDTFPGYPYIVMELPRLNMDMMGLDQSNSDVMWDFEIEVRSSDYIRGHHGDGAAYCGLIMDDILKTINDTTNKKLLRNYGMEDSDELPEVDDIDVIGDAADRVFIMRLSVPFSRRLVVG